MRHQRLFLATVLAGSLAFAACGGDDEKSDAPQTGGGKGHWSAAQLCSLTDETAVGALFTGVDIEESPGIDDADWSACVWKDADGGAVSPNLFTINNRDHDGAEFADSFEPLDLPGANQSVFAENFGGTSAVLATVGDQLLEVDFEPGTVGGRELAVAIAQAWMATQA